MPSPVPTPVAAALGLVPTVLSGVRRLPGKAVQLPLLAVSSGFMALDQARREYDELAARGERLLAKLRGASFDDLVDELEDRVEDRLHGTPLARPYDAVEDALEDAADAVAGVATKAGSAARTGTAQAAAAVKTGDAPAKAAQAPAKTAGRARAAGRAADGTTRAAEAPKGRPTPKAPQPADTLVDSPAAAPADPPAGTPPAAPVDTAASPDVVETVEQVAQQSAAPAVTDHDELPLPDYDHMTLGSLRGRLRTLTTDQLVQLRDYEKAHANRLPVVTMLDNRIAKLATDSSATQSGGDPTAPVPEKAPAAAGRSTVSPATGGPAQNPPSHGDPTNPAQPRSSGSGSTNPA